MLYLIWNFESVEVNEGGDDVLPGLSAGENPGSRALLGTPDRC